MNYLSTSDSYGSTGIQSLYTGFLPVCVEITVGQKYNTTQNFTHLSIGAGDNNYQRVTAIYQDSTGGKTVTTDGKIVSVWERVGGTLTEVLSLSISSFTSNTVEFNVTTANSNYSLHIRVWG